LIFKNENPSCQTCASDTLPVTPVPDIPSATSRPWVLASSSPRRTALLDGVGVTHLVDPPGVDETAMPGETPAALTERLARLKAETVAARHPEAIVLGADTIVSVENRILGKPGSDAEWAAMLRLLSGRTHLVNTGVALVKEGQMVSEVGQTEVRFRDLSEREIAWYVASGESRDKAGGYALQGKGAALVASIHGSFTNVVGLPVELLIRLAARIGIPLLPNEIG